ncbi:heme ABC transporter ATP-binding protein [Leucobacter sp. M11]|uniref:heme ABC transporter ATP-binding protein n=1 Tax=Leucobacter sp. M11 TaxID=2993565 RepID=UPI002D7F758D|nr:heme ABC transporter ATP-binding protein [Leucobacter sp. M11]MEB4615155.1 heme ABC transporter ATP-binding protein [Leucobacter sp. M11]
MIAGLLGGSARTAPLPEPLPAGTVAIEATDVTVRIDGRDLLSEASLSVRTGEVLALIGPNGAGKSTLLAAMTGDLPRTGGDVRIAGRPLADWTLRELSQRRAVLPQENGVFFPFTVQQVVEMGRAPWQRTERDREDDAAVDEALQLTDIERFRGRRVPSLSGGERARAALARILAQRTGVLLLDEPTAALDLKHQEAVLSLAAERAALGDAVIVVLHDLNLAAAYANRIAMLSRGRIVASGAPDEVLTAARIGEVYEQPVDVIRHPLTGATLIVPVRGVRPTPLER